MITFKRTLIARLVIWLIDKIPPRGAEIETYLCVNCSRVRLMGELHSSNPHKMYCAKCGSNRVRVPKKIPVFRLLFCTIFRRKDLLWGLEEGFHNTFKHEFTPELPEILKQRLQDLPEGGNNG